MPVPTHAERPIKRTTLRDDAYKALRGAILGGVLMPGERLDDKQLQEWLGVSRTPIREAITVLAAEGLIDLEAQRHTRVALPRPERAIEEIRTVGALMSGVYRQTVPELDEGSKEQLCAAIRAVMDAAQAADPQATVDAIQEMHEVALLLCPNRTLAKIVATAHSTLGFHIRASLGPDVFQWGLLYDNCELLLRCVDGHEAINVESMIADMHYIPHSESA